MKYTAFSGRSHVGVRSNHGVRVSSSMSRARRTQRLWACLLVIATFLLLHAPVRLNYRQLARLHKLESLPRTTAHGKKGFGSQLVALLWREFATSPPPF